MAWWIWVIVGIALLGAELTLIAADFYLVFVGLAAILTGIAVAWLPEHPAALEWAIFVVLSILGVATFRRSLAARLHVKGVPSPSASPIGAELVLPETLAPDAAGRIEFRGAYWSVRNGAGVELSAGTRVKVVRVHALELVVEP
jgi:inner membrane protein